MRFIIMRKADVNTEAGMAPGEELMTKMAAFIQEMVDAGVMVSGDGLKPTSRGARVSFAGGTPTVIDGPFTEAKELVAGLTVIDVPSLREAVEWARRWPTIDGDGEVQLEIRQFYELSDFPEGEGLDQLRQAHDDLAG